MNGRVVLVTSQALRTLRSSGQASGQASVQAENRTRSTSFPPFLPPNGTLHAEIGIRLYNLSSATSVPSDKVKRICVYT